MFKIKHNGIDYLTFSWTNTLIKYIIQNNNNSNNNKKIIYYHFKFGNITQLMIKRHLSLLARLILQNIWQEENFYNKNAIYIKEKMSN